MTNKEKYRQAFSTLHASDNISLEVENMKNKKKSLVIRPAVAFALCAVLLFGTATTAYAADVGGIRTEFTAWIHGMLVNITVKSDNPDDGYVFSYYDDEKGEVTFGGGGVSIDIDENGVETESALSAEEVLREVSCEVVTEDDGRVILYYNEHAADITDLYKEGSVCKVVIMDKGEPVYFDIESNGDDGYHMSRSGKPTGSADDYKVFD